MKFIPSIHRQFLNWLAPTILCGSTMSIWWRLLRENGWRVAPRYYGRAAMITLVTGLNSIGRRIEHLRFGRSIEQAQIHPPIFILGCWRSGTTHLHNLLGQDERFAYPSSYHVMNPYTFLHMEAWNKRIQALFMPDRRAMDNVRFAADDPQEDEFAVACMCGISSMMAFTFWDRRQHFYRYTSFNGVPDREVRLWKDTLLHFLKKLTVKFDRPLVLKSPQHTAKIAALLELFPNARFINIHRHPYDVLVSGEHMVVKNLPWLALQPYDAANLQSEIIEHFGQLFDAYFDQRHLIPEGRLVEVSYDELDQRPIETLATIYRELQLSDFAATETAMRAYLENLGDYEKNTHLPLTEVARDRVARRWRRCFDAWGYAMV